MNLDYIKLRCNCEEEPSTTIAGGAPSATIVLMLEYKLMHLISSHLQFSVYQVVAVPLVRTRVCMRQHIWLIFTFKCTISVDAELVLFFSFGVVTLS